MFQKLEDVEKKYEELNNQYIRLAADFDNYRKRQAQERESLLKYRAEDTLKKLFEKGNLCCDYHSVKGNVEKGFDQSFVVIEDVLKRVEQDYDYFVLLQPTSPLRNEKHIILLDLPLTFAFFF